MWEGRFDLKANGDNYKMEKQKQSAKSRSAKTKKRTSGQEKLTKYFPVEKAPAKRIGAAEKKTSAPDEKPKSEIASITDYFHKSRKKASDSKSKGAEKQSREAAKMEEIVVEESEVEVVQSGENGGKKPGEEREKNEKKAGICGDQSMRVGDRERGSGPMRGRMGNQRGGDRRGGQVEASRSRNVGLSEILESVVLSGDKAAGKTGISEVEGQRSGERLEPRGSDQLLGKRSEFEKPKKRAEKSNPVKRKDTKKVKTVAKKEKVEKSSGAHGQERPEPATLDKVKEAKTKKLRSRIKKQDKINLSKKQARKKKVLEISQQRKSIQVDTNREATSGSDLKTAIQCCEPVIREELHLSNQPEKAVSAKAKSSKKEPACQVVENPKETKIRATPQKAKRQAATRTRKKSKSKKKGKKEIKPRTRSALKVKLEKETLRQVLFTFEELNTINKNNGVTRKALIDKLMSEGWPDSVEKIDLNIQNLSERNKIFITDERDMIYKI